MDQGSYTGGIAWIRDHIQEVSLGSGIIYSTGGIAWRYKDRESETNEGNDKEQKDT